MSEEGLEAQRQDAALRRDEVSRGEQARRIYESRLFKEAVEAVKDRIWDAFRKADPTDDKALRTSRLELDCLDNICKELRRHIETGTLARQQLPMIERAINTMLRRSRK